MKTEQKQPNYRTASQNKRIHFLLSHQKIIDLKAAFALEYSNGRTDKTSELYYIEAQQLINSLEDLMHTGHTKRGFIQNADMDKKRKGVIKAIFTWYENQSREVSIEYVKATACRAAGVAYFNQISSSALTRIYAEFCKKQHIQTTMQDLHVDVSKN